MISRIWMLSDAKKGSPRDLRYPSMGSKDARLTLLLTGMLDRTKDSVTEDDKGALRTNLGEISDWLLAIIYCLGLCTHILLGYLALQREMVFISDFSPDFIIFITLGFFWIGIPLFTGRLGL